MGRNTFNRPPGDSRQDRAQKQREARDRRIALFSKMKIAKTRPDAAVASPEADTSQSHSQRDVDAYMTALAAMPLYPLGSNAEVPLAPWYQTFVLSAVDVMNGGGDQVVMSWPLSQTCPSGIVDLLAVAAVGGARRTRIDIRGSQELAFEQADKLRIVLYPYARSTHAAARQVQVDSAQFGSIHFDHVKRYLDDNAETGTKDYHQVLSRVRQLTRETVHGDSFGEFEHPILDELVPHGPPNGDRPANGELLWRTKSKTDIGKLSRSGAADDPSTAAYYIYTIRAKDRLDQQLRAIKGSTDLVIIDLSRAARARLGLNWPSQARNAIKQIRKVQPETGILALTDNPWVYRLVRFELLGSRKSGKRAKTVPAPGRVVFSPERSILAHASRSRPEFEGAREISIDGFYGDVDRTIENLRALARGLEERGDAPAAAVVREVIATVRRSASLPGSLAAFGRFLETETTTAMAADLFIPYRVGTNLTALSDARNLASQLDAESQATACAVEVMRSLETATPMASLLNEALQAPLRSSSRSLVVFRSEMIAEFAVGELSLSNDKLKGRLEKDMIRFGAAPLVATVSATSRAFRNQFKRIILVAPTGSAILAMFAEPWLPERMTILADADTLAFAAKDAERLARELDEEPVARRLNDFAAQAHRRVTEIGRHAVRFDNEMPPEDIEFPSGMLVDLSGGGGERDLIEIQMRNGQRILARQSTYIVVRGAGAIGSSFIEKPASEVRVGEEVCVIGPEFIERARTLVSFRATAAGEIREYHSQVAARFSRLPGDSKSERLRCLVSAMGDPPISPQRARYWISLDEEIEKELHEVVPHAPQDRGTFLRFTDALGIGTKLAENFWRWAVVAQRSHRVRAGTVFHDAFRGILTDPHAALAEHVERGEEIRALRWMADDHVTTVAKVVKVKTR